MFLEVLRLGLEAHHHRPKHYPGLKEPGFWVIPDSELDRLGAGRMSLLLLRLLWKQAPHHHWPGASKEGSVETQTQPVRSCWLRGRVAPPLNYLLLRPLSLKIKTLDKAGVLHRTKIVDKGKRLR